MATYTASNAIKKIATGDESGTWGDSTNNNADIIDRASNGFVAIALTGTSYTLSLSTTAVLSLGHYKAIRFHGTPGGTCTVTLEQDNKPRMYMIYNNTDESVIINQGSGSGTKVTIPTGDSAIVLADGTGTNANVIDFTGQITGLSLLTGITAGTVAASKAVVVDANKDITGFRNLTATGAATAGSLVIGSADISATDLEQIDDITAGTVAASKALVVDSNKKLNELLVDNLQLNGSTLSSTDTHGHIYIAPDGTGNIYASTDLLQLTGANDEATKIILAADNSDDNGDDWVIQANTSQTLQIGNDISGSQVAHLTITPHATVASSTSAFAGHVTVGHDLDVNGDLHIIAANNETARLLLSSDNSDDNGDDWIIQAQTSNNTLVITNDISGSVTSQMTITPNATASNSTAAFPGKITAGNDITTSGSLVIGSASMSETDLEQLDDITAGTVAASKAVVVNADKDITGFRNLTMTGGTFTTGLSTFNLLASFNSSHGISCSSYRPPSGVNEVVNFLSSGGDQRISFQMAALPIQTISQNGTTLKLKTTALSTAQELSYPDASGTLATTNQLITIDGVTAGTVSASKALIVDSNKKLNELLVDNITIDGDAVKFINSQNASNFASITSTHLTSSSSTLELRSANAGLTLNSGGSTILLEYDGTQRGYLKLDTAGAIKFYTGTGTGTLSTTISGDDLTVVGAATAGSLVIGSADISATDLEQIDDITAGTVAASKAVVVDANKDIAGFRNLTINGKITSDSNADVTIEPNGSGDFVVETDSSHFRNTDAGQFGPKLFLDHATSSPATSDYNAQVYFKTTDLGSNIIYPLRIDVLSPDVTDSAATGKALFNIKEDGASDPIAYLELDGDSEEIILWKNTSISGDLVVTGAISKGSGSFKIDHPIPSKKDTHHLVHSFLEGPQADLIYRGVVNLVGGSASVNIDTAARMTTGTFVLLCGNVQSFTSNESGWTAVKSSVSGNTLTITAQDNTCTDSVSWMVVGERKDQHMLDTNWTDENGRVIVEPEKQMEE